MQSLVRAVLRRTGQNDAAKILQVGNLMLNTGEHTVFAGGERVQLTLKEYKILKRFMENLGLVFTQDQLLDSVWGNGYIGETRTVDVHIGTLRTKLGACGDYIETVRGVGYRMEARL